MNWFKDNIRSMEAYVPGEQPRSADRIIKLNTNENPYPPSPKVAEALSAVDLAQLRRYPDAMATLFRNAAADVLGVPADWILPGNGSDDVIMMIARACLGPARPAAFPVPTFEFYRTQSLIEDALRTEVPLEEDYRLPVEKLIDAAAAVTFIANPNSPTGVAADNDALAELADGLEGLVVIDEAYVDFADASAIDLLEGRDNVILLRTLSKGYSLAGLRLGFGVARPPVLKGLLKTKSIYNVGSLPCLLGTAALRDPKYTEKRAGQIVATRKRLAAALETAGWRVWDSQANFLFTQPPEDSAARIAAGLRKRNIYIRYYDQPGVSDKLRISIGTEEETDALLSALSDLT
ncbi:MAG: histidinol-phosphate transaminase [Planctomycetota bacterium]